MCIRDRYQSGGALGFRDQLQDSVNLLLIDPAYAREQIPVSYTHLDVYKRQLSRREKVRLKRHTRLLTGIGGSIRCV